MAVDICIAVLVVAVLGVVGALWLLDKYMKWGGGSPNSL